MMTAREQRDFEEGKRYGYRKPGIMQKLWKSAAYNQGLLAGTRQYREDKNAEKERKHERWLEWRRSMTKRQHRRAKELKETTDRFVKDWEGMGK